MRCRERRGFGLGEQAGLECHVWGPEVGVGAEGHLRGGHSSPSLQLPPSPSSPHMILTTTQQVSQLASVFLFYR